MTACELCNGSGMVAVGPWGVRPPRVQCERCGGRGTHFPERMTSGKVQRDPKPYVDERGFRWTPPAHGNEPLASLMYDPRARYDNDNPVLVELRWDIGVLGNTAWGVKNQLDALAWGEWNTQATHEQRTHARRVLTKLAAIS